MNDDTVPSQVLYPLSSHCRIVIFNADINFADPGTDNVPGAATLGRGSVQTRLKSRKQNAAIEPLMTAFPLKQNKLGVITISQFAARCGFDRSVRTNQHRSDRRTWRAIWAMLSH